jgi:hypothetical protein
MIVIRDNKLVADIYFGEFMRVFDHFHERMKDQRYGHGLITKPPPLMTEARW